MHIADEGIVGRNSVRVARVDVEPQDRAQQRGAILAVAKSVIGADAVAKPDIQVPAGTELELSTVVHIRGLSQVEQDAFALPDCAVGIGGNKEL